MNEKRRTIAVIGGGPAGLMAAETAANQGAVVTVYDHKPSVGRKLLIAGKSGLNLTNDSSLNAFCSRYSGTKFPADLWRGFLEGFDNNALRAWALSLGVETFTAGGGKVFPEEKKAAPLLRRWLARLKDAGVCFEMKHAWTGLSREVTGVQLHFKHMEQVRVKVYDAVVLALGGASWPQTGSDGAWSSILAEAGVGLMPLRAANCGWECNWNSDTKMIAEGKPLHHVQIKADGQFSKGEIMVTRYGLEGTPIYNLGPCLHAMEKPEVEIDFKPIFSLQHMIRKMESVRRDFYKEARLRWKLTDATCAILKQQYGEFNCAEDLARAAKSCRIELTRARPIAEAISSTGGVAWDDLDATLMLKQLPSVYCAGEMIDWDAPTGGFLLQGCFATGRAAGYAAAQ